MKTIVTLFFALSIAAMTCSHAQQQDLTVLRNICSQNSKSHDHAEISTHKRMTFPLRLLFGFYRHTVSEQISADCAFDLTCSRFSAAAIRKFGIIKGGLLTADRLTRCHVLVAQETVPVYFNMQSGKVIDEPAMY